jgi:PIN domain nuclease of toxin-antitoxin system
MIKEWAGWPRRFHDSSVTLRRCEDRNVLRRLFSPTHGTDPNPSPMSWTPDGTRPWTVLSTRGLRRPLAGRRSGRLRIVKLLLDTQVWLWWNTAPERLARSTIRQIENPRNDIFLSVASVWEMAIKRRLGKLPLPEPVGAYVARRLESDAVTAVPVSLDHAGGVETLEGLHRDPFDRILIVQARHEGLRLLTADDLVLAYGSPTVDVRPGRA